MARNKVRFAVVGTNFITDWVLKGAFMDDRFELVAVYSRTYDQGKSFADKYGVERIYTDLETMARDSEIDAVYIASPNSMHAQQSILCMRHGKHVLCEKAFCSNAREAREMVKVAKEQGVVLMEAMKPTLTPNFRAVKENLHKAGKIRRYFSCYCQYSSRYDKLKNEGIVLNAWRPEMSNGSLPDIGVYTIYPMVVLFGMPKTIQASGVLLSTGVDGEGSVVFGYDDMDAVVIFSKIADSNLPTEIQGEAGNLWLDRINIISQVKWMPRGGEAVDLTQPHCGEEYFYEVKEFLDLIESGKLESETNSHATSIAVMEIMDEIRRQLGVIYPADKE